MFELLKKMVMQQIASKVMGSSLGAAAGGAVAEQGAGAFVSMIQEKMGAGGLSEITSMFTGGDGANEMVSGFSNKLGNIMQEQGMPAEEATEKVGNAVPDIMNTLKEKFASTDAADSGFDLSALAGLAGGAGGMLGGAADMLKGANAGDLLGKAKNLF